MDRRLLANVLGDAQSAGEAAQRVGQQVWQAGSDAIGQATDVAHDAKDRASSVAGAIGDKAASMADEQKSHLADKLEDVAKAVHRSGEQLEGHQDFVAHLVERGAAELSVLAKTLRHNDLQGLLNELGGLARRQPALVRWRLDGCGLCSHADRPFGRLGSGECVVARDSAPGLFRLPRLMRCLRMARVRRTVMSGSKPLGGQRPGTVAR